MLYRHGRGGAAPAAFPRLRGWQRCTLRRPPADVNGDGIVDLIETEAVSGKTMVPFTADPVSLDIVTDTYPKASADETCHYRQTVSLSELQEAFAEAFNGQDLDLDGRVVYIHSVLPSMVMPDSVASLGDIPAHVTLPIACGEIEASGD